MMDNSHHLFTWVEYIVFVAMLAISAAIGLYFGCYKKNQNTVSEYLFGGKNMGTIPITVSLLASTVSGITLIGLPAEVYVYGTQYFAVVFSQTITMIVIIQFFIPVFFKLQLTTLYQYLELRFSHSVRVLASGVFAIALLTHIPVVIYIPALAFSQVSGLGIHTITPFVGLVCIFYTTLGGLKAVVWTDTIQSFLIFLSVIVVAVMGCNSLGGLQNIFEISAKGGRLELFNMDPDPFARHTFWTMTIGCSFSLLSYQAVHPGTIQRFTAVPTQSAAKAVMFWFSMGFIVLKILTTLLGLIMYTEYNGCDPLASGVVTKSGQLLPLYVMDLGGKIPGFSGLFIAGVVSAALSTMSASLNTVAGTIYEDFVTLFYKTKSEATASLIMKIIVIIVGVISVLLVFVIERLGAIIQMALSLGGMTHGPLLSLFILGLFFPWANAKGALLGALTSLAVMAWLVIGTQTVIAEKLLRFPGKITSINSCPANFTYVPDYNTTVSRLSSYTGVGSPVIADDSVLQFYKLSYMYYNLLGALIGVVVGLVVSFITGSQDISKLDPDLLVPQIHRFLPSKQSKNEIIISSITSKFYGNKTELKEVT